MGNERRAKKEVAFCFFFVLLSARGNFSRERLVPLCFSTPQSYKRGRCVIKPVLCLVVVVALLVGTNLYLLTAQPRAEDVPGGCYYCKLIRCTYVCYSGYTLGTDPGTWREINCALV